MNPPKYSKGVFLNIISKDKNGWKKQADFINSLPNVNHVEIWIEENLKPAEIKFLKSLLKGYKILIHCPFVHLSLISPHPEIREITLKLYLGTLKIAEALKAELVTFHAGSKMEFIPGKTAATPLIQNLKKIKNHSRGRINFTIENLPPKTGPYNHFPESLKDLAYLKKLLPWLNFTLDIGHAFQSGENLDEISRFLKKHKNSILDIHLHDATLKGRAHLALGEGDLDINAFFKLLNEIGYSGYVSLETLTRNDTRKSWKKIYKK